MAGQGATVVVVDDDTSMREAVERLLHVSDFTPLAFASAEALLASAVASSADCFVIDIRLPGLGGFALHDRLRADGCQAPVIFVTAHDSPSVRDQAARAGSAGYLAKPFLGSALLEVVHRALLPAKATH